jgi:hypothetical protein
MARWMIAVGLAAGVMAAGDASARPGGTSTVSVKKSGTSVKKSGTSAKKSGTSAKKSAKRSHAGVARANGSNLPRGFTWPPSPAMTDAEADCEHQLDAASVAWKPAARDGRIVDAVTIDDATLGGIAYVPVYGKGPYKLDCQLALALATIGSELHAAGVREVHFGSIYRWSNVRVGGKTKPALSRHALGLAMDVVSFVGDAGREANVARDYRHDDALLLEVERTINASSSFRLVLTPKNDPISHKDHFHIEANPTYAAAPPRS